MYSKTVVVSNEFGLHARPASIFVIQAKKFKSEITIQMDDKTLNAKSMAAIGGFVAGPKEIINYLRYNLRSQIYAKSLPMPLVEGCLKRVEMIRTMPELREKLWIVTRAMQKGLRERGFNIGKAEACVTPVFLEGNVAEATNILIDLRTNYKIFCSVVAYPVVPKGVLMFRLIPTAMHSLEDVDYTLNAFGEIQTKLKAGFYKGEEMQDMSLE